MTALLGDVGGTNARFTLLQDGRHRHETVVNCASYASLSEAIKDYLTKAGVSRVNRAAIALAGPVVNEQVVLTNLNWTVTRENIAQAAGVQTNDKVWLVNDFHALALSLDKLPANELLWLGGAKEKKPMGNLAVIGPGTGLGAAGLIRNGQTAHAVVGEGGHMSASAANEREWKIIGYLLSRGMKHVSWERLISGSGLPALHEALCAVDGFQYEALNSAQIGEHAKAQSDKSCVATIETFSAMLGSFAGDVALAFGATGGVFVAGGIIPKLGAAFSAEKFRARFTDKGRFEPYLAPIATYLVQSPFPAFIGLGTLVE